MKSPKIITFDLDNVICKNKKYKNGLINYTKSRPIKNAIRVINNLHLKGYQIDIFTARGMSRYSGDMKKILKNLKPITTNQLKKWKVKYHNLYFGKPYYDYFVDDKSFGFDKNWHAKIEAKLISIF